MSSLFVKVRFRVRLSEVLMTFACLPVVFQCVLCPVYAGKEPCGYSADTFTYTMNNSEDLLPEAILHRCSFTMLLIPRLVEL